MADEIEAGLYVLGVLEWEEMQEMAQRALREPALADAIAAWETKLAPLGVLAGSAEPPPDLWARIAASLRPTPASRAAAMKSMHQQASLWQRAFMRPAIPLAVAALALPFILVPTIALLLQQNAVTPLAQVAALPATRTAAIAPLGTASQGWFAHVYTDGTIVIDTLGKVPLPPAKDLQLWALADGAKTPMSLGLMPVASRKILPPQSLPAGKFQLLVSLEPKGGSPTGLPTGPVLYGGLVTLQ